MLQAALCETPVGEARDSEINFSETPLKIKSYLDPERMFVVLDFLLEHYVL